MHGGVRIWPARTPVRATVENTTGVSSTTVASRLGTAVVTATTANTPARRHPERLADGDGDLVIIQCKRYRARITSGHAQQFNDTARSHHGADVAIMIGSADFTDHPAAAFARQHRITVLGRAEIKKWAHGTHLYRAVYVLI